ncbi:MAG: pyridoxal-phosphate dependent enzyme [Candidatus Eisenbacteria bacterium]
MSVSAPPFDRGLPGLAELRAAHERSRRHALRTPLVRAVGEPGEREVWLKLETLQPIGSFKIRGAANALAVAPAHEVARGVLTASAGNMAQGVAWVARSLGVPCTVIAPDSAPAAKLDAIARMGGRVVRVPFARWWQVLEERAYEDVPGWFVHPVSDEAVLVGNAGIGLELLEDLPRPAAVLVPFGGGGLACGIAMALRAAGVDTPVYACEVATAAPLAASFAAGSPQSVSRTPSFVDGIGGSAVLASMWPLARTLLAGSAVVPLAAVGTAVRTLALRARVVAEGAGACAFAVASGEGTVTRADGAPGALPDGPCVCIVSGGNMDAAVLARLLLGEPA